MECSLAVVSKSHPHRRAALCIHLQRILLRTLGKPRLSLRTPGAAFGNHPLVQETVVPLRCKHQRNDIRRGKKKEKRNVGKKKE